MGIGLFSREIVTGQEKWPKLCHESFRLNVRKNFITERVVKHRNRLPREMVETPSLEEFKNQVDGVLEDLV